MIKASPGRGVRFFALAATVALGSLAVAGTAGATPTPSGLTCSTVLTHSVTLQRDLDCSLSGGGPRIAANNVTINLAGHRLNGHVATANPTVAVSGLTVENGTLTSLSAYNMPNVTLRYLTFDSGAVVTVLDFEASPGAVIDHDRFLHGSFIRFTRDRGAVLTADEFVGGTQYLTLDKAGDIVVRGSNFMGLGEPNLQEKVIDPATQDAPALVSLFQSTIDISYSYLTGGYAGLNVNGGSTAIVNNNVISNNEFGIYVSNPGNPMSGPMVDSNFNHNFIENNGVAGLYIRTPITGGTGNVGIHNFFIHNGFSPDPIFPGVHDGMYVTTPNFIPTYPGPQGDLGITVIGNIANYNAGHGIYAPDVTDGGGNTGTGNATPPLCIGKAGISARNAQQCALTHVIPAVPATVDVGVRLNTCPSEVPLSPGPCHVVSAQLSFAAGKAARLAFETDVLTAVNGRVSFGLEVLCSLTPSTGLTATLSPNQTVALLVVHLTPATCSANQVVGDAVITPPVPDETYIIRWDRGSLAYGPLARARPVSYDSTVRASSYGVGEPNRTYNASSMSWQAKPATPAIKF